jgi:signal peptidase I
MTIVLLGLAGPLVLAALAVAAVRWAAGRWVAVTVTGDSMAPALSDGDRVLVRRSPLERLTVGNVVVASWPTLHHSYQPGSDRPWLIKRVAALPGDLVPDSVSAAAGGEIHVPPRHLVLLGDNPKGSHDSRTFGYIPGDLVLGAVVRRLR